MNGTDLAKDVIVAYQTHDIQLLAQRAGVRVVYARWHPTTYGEFDTQSQTISINLNAPLAKEHILAHELGHFFAHRAGCIGDRNTQETIAEAFAQYLLAQ